MNSIVKTLLIATVFMACKNQTTQNPAATNALDASVILKHKYWVSKAFNDAFFAPNIMDTISNLPCGELVFGQKDSLLMTACLSDAGRGTYKVTTPTSLEIAFEGFEGKPSAARYDEKTGILHIEAPGGENTGWPTEFVAQDGIDVANIDNVTINLGRKRLAGSYSILPQKGQMAITALVELHADGTQLGFGDFDTYEPWPSGIGGSFIQNPQRNLMYLVKKGQEADPTAVGWQVHGDTLRIWNTKNTGAEGDLPEYKIQGLMGTYLKAK
jgi:hypothetical protein